MKKILIAFALLAFAATPVLAIQPFDADKPLTQGTETICKPSNNVYGAVVSSANQFAAVTKHKNGTRNFATSSTDTKIYWTAVADANKGKTTLEITLSNSDTSDFNSWTAL